MDLILVLEPGRIVIHGEGQTNAGKKESRQIDHLLDKAAKEGDRTTIGK